METFNIITGILTVLFASYSAISTLKMTEILRSQLDHRSPAGQVIFGNRRLFYFIAWYYKNKIKTDIALIVPTAIFGILTVITIG